jgi:hypothetical protein
MIPLILQTAPSWVEAFKRIAANPVVLLVWVIVGLVILFLLSRFNNYMEVRGVNRAIVIARSFVGVIMWFLIVPFVIYLLINIFAAVHGAPLFGITFLFQWIGLTASSYWWLIKCALGSEDLLGQKEIYSPDAIVRIFWVLVPLSLIWYRTAQTRVMRLLLIPIILGVLVVTRHKKSEETFIVRDFGLQNLQNLPVVGALFQDEKISPNGVPLPAKKMNATQQKLIAGALVVVMIAGFMTALYWQKRVMGLIVVMIGLAGFFLASPTTDKTVRKAQYDKNHAIHTNIDSLLRVLDSIYTREGTSTNVYKLTLQIDQAFDAQHDERSFPDSLCGRYAQYFYDRCH